MMNTSRIQEVFLKDKDIAWEILEPGIQRKIIAYDKHLMMVRLSFESGKTGPLHNHPHSQITHVESGVFEVTIGNQKQQLTTGDAFYIPSNEMHGVECLEDGILLDFFSPAREDFIK